MKNCKNYLAHGIALLALISSANYSNASSFSTPVDMASVFNFVDDAGSQFEKEHERFRNERGNLVTNDQIIERLNELLKLELDPDLKYQIAILKVRALSLRALNQPDKDARILVHEDAMRTTTLAKQTNPDYADTYYLHAVHLGGWALAKGILNALSRKAEIFAALDATIARLSFDGEDGEAYALYGAYRLYGKIYHELPGIAGGDERKALSYITKAFQKAPSHPLNVAYYAEILYAQGRDRRAEACTILDRLLEHNPSTYNPERVPECIREFEEAKRLRDNMRC